jgi:hypothetical protein
MGKWRVKTLGGHNQPLQFFPLKKQARGARSITALMLLAPLACFLIDFIRVQGWKTKDQEKSSIYAIIHKEALKPELTLHEYGNKHWEAIE